MVGKQPIAHGAVVGIMHRKAEGNFNAGGSGIVSLK